MFSFVFYKVWYIEPPLSISVSSDVVNYSNRTYNWNQIILMLVFGFRFYCSEGVHG